VLRALSRPTIDHRGPEFADLTAKLLTQLKRVFQTEQPVIVYPSSGTGAWEAALANCLSPGDRVLAFETGHFATLWRDLATALGLEVDFVPGDWRHGVDPQAVGERLAADRGHAIAAVTVVHNETSTGVRSRIPEVRAAMDRAGHPALLLADTVSWPGTTGWPRPPGPRSGRGAWRCCARIRANTPARSRPSCCRTAPTALTSPG